MPDIASAAIRFLSGLAGLAGYLFVIGGADIWIQAKASQIPTIWLLGVTPTQELFVIGSLTVARWLLFTAAAFIVGVLVIGGLRLAMSSTLLRRIAAGLSVVLAVAALIASPFLVLSYRRTAIVFAVVAAATAAIGFLLLRAGQFRGWLGDQHDSLVPSREAARGWIAPTAAVALAGLAVPAFAVAHGFDKHAGFYRVGVRLLGGRCLYASELSRTDSDLYVATAAPQDPDDSGVQVLDVPSSEIQALVISSDRNSRLLRGYVRQCVPAAVLDTFGSLSTGRAGNRRHQTSSKHSNSEATGSSSTHPPRTTTVTVTTASTTTVTVTTAANASTTDSSNGSGRGKQGSSGRRGPKGQRELPVTR